MAPYCDSASHCTLAHCISPVFLQADHEMLSEYHHMLFSTITYTYCLCQGKCPITAHCCPAGGDCHCSHQYHITRITSWCQSWFMSIKSALVSQHYYFVSVKLSAGKTFNLAFKWM